MRFDVTDHPDESEAIHPPSEEKVREWTTVLAAAGISSAIVPRDGVDVLVVCPRQRARAWAAIEAYEADNVDWPPKPAVAPEEPRRHYRTWAPWVATACLVLLYARFGPYDSGHAVLRSAAADSEAIRAGEWWRVVTAMTLHSGLSHLAGNGLFLLFLGHAVGRSLGGGIGCALILASGVAGNLVVACFSPGQHVGVGASGACFGALGVMSAEQAVRSLQRHGLSRSVWNRVWLPLAAGVALLGFLGSGPGSDLAAHAVGFAAGAILAVPFSWRGTRWIPDWMQQALLVACALVVWGSWWAVYRHLTGV